MFCIQKRRLKYMTKRTNFLLTSPYNVSSSLKISYLSATRARTMNLPQRYTHYARLTRGRGDGGGGGGFYYHRTYKGLAFFLFLIRSTPPGNYSVSAPTHSGADCIRTVRRPRCKCIRIIIIYMSLRNVYIQNDFQRYNFTISIIKYYIRIIRSHPYSYLTFSHVHFTGQPAFTHYSASVNTKSVYYYNNDY